jgi:head-tail adaptor
MSLRTMLTRAITIITPGVTTSAAGDQKEDWHAATTRVQMAWINPLRGREDNQHLTDAVTAEWEVILPPTDPITARDRISYDGRLLQITSAPERKYSPRGPNHLVVRATQYNGYRP